MASLNASCAGVGADAGAGKNTAGFTAADTPRSGSSMLNVAGTIDIDLQHVNVEACAGPIFNLTNTNYGSQLRVGAFEASSPHANILTAGRVATSGSQQHDTSFSQRPQYAAFDLFNNTGSLANISYPPLPGTSQQVGSNASFQYPFNAHNYTLTAAAVNGTTGVMVALPRNPFNYKEATITPIVIIANLAITTATSGATIQGYTTGNVAAFRDDKAAVSSVLSR